MMTAGYNTGSKWRDIQLEANFEIADTYNKQNYDEATYTSLRQQALTNVSNAIAPGSDSDYE